jgi:hypothetical protein
MSELAFIAIPGGAGAVLRALVVPRLTGGDGTATLAAYGLADWPDALRNSTLSVEVAADAGSALVPLQTTLRSQADSVLWTRMFAGTSVKPWTPPPTYHDPEVVPSSKQLATVEQVYAATAWAGGDASVATTGAIVAPSNLSPVVPEGAVAGAHQPPDFHQAITLLREHPAVLRALGLVLEFDVTGIDGLAGRPTGVVRVVCGLPAELAARFEVASPWTHYEYAAKRFFPAPKPDSDISRGLLQLQTDRWTTATYDASTAMDRLRVATAQGSVDTLPFLRSTGLHLLRRGLGDELIARNQQGNANAGTKALSASEFWADDLVLGYRVDVRRSDTDWGSLCRRLAQYKTADQTYGIGTPEEEEGHVKAGGVTVRGRDPEAPEDPVEGVDPRRYLADETFVRWDGSSMVCPHPLRTTARRAADADPTQRRLPFLHWDFEPVGLSTLRFGNQYALRLRVADLAGGGLTFKDELDQLMGATPDSYYGRHDPVHPPEIPPPPGVLTGADEQVVDPAALGPGGLVDLLVIRSDPNHPDGPMDVEQYAAAHPYPGNARRLLLPPPASFVLCEQLGMFDEERYPDGLSDEQFAEWLAASTTPPTYTADGQYSWLPDPSADGVTLHARPGPGFRGSTGDPQHDAKESWKVPTGSWPELPAKPLDVVPRGLAERPLESIDHGARMIVRLAPAEEVVVDVSSSVTADAPLAMTNWLKTKPAGLPATTVDLTELQNLVLDGRHPQVSPARQLHLVHAVQHPRTAPSGRLVASREAAQTFAVLRTDDTDHNPLLGIDPPSTLQLDVVATWDEFDPMGTDQPVRRPVLQVGSYQLAADARSHPAISQEFGDTRHRSVDYTLTANSRFRRFFDHTDQVADFQTATTFTVEVPSTANPPAPVVTSVSPSFVWQDSSEPGAYRRTRRGGLVRVELAKPWNASGVGELLGVVVFGKGSGVAPEGVRSLISRVRRDPIWATPTPAGDLPGNLFRRQRTEATLRAPGDQHDLLVLGHQVAYEPTAGRWFADVEIGLGDSYSPFVQLAVARYQPGSLQGCELSTVVRTDPVQLLPERTVTVTQQPAGLVVQLEGLGPLGPGQNVVKATLEQLAAELDPAMVELTAIGDRPAEPPAWRQIAAAEGPLGSALPAIAVPGQPGHYRLVVREIEQFTETAESPLGELAERTTFVDIISLPLQ